jgi:hypothetical protein
MMTAEEIVHLIRERIGAIYALPNTYVGDLGELDGALFQLHWLFAQATGRMDDFVAAAEDESSERFLRYMAITQSHRAIGASDETPEIIERWKARGARIGLTN